MKVCILPLATSRLGECTNVNGLELTAVVALGGVAVLALGNATLLQVVPVLGLLDAINNGPDSLLAVLLIASELA